MFIWFVSLALIGVMADAGNCHGGSEVMLNIAGAGLALWIFWYVELRPRFKWRRA
ncbi:hypothetical protein D9M69_659400 [compost metagenome]